MLQLTPTPTAPQTAPLAVGGSLDILSADRKLASLFTPLREAELKHSRLAMLAAVGWPVSELIHPSLVNAMGAPNLLVDGRAPSLVNGGLFEPGLLPALSAAMFLGATLELIDLRMKQTSGLDTVLGSIAASYQEASGVDGASFIPRPRQPGHISNWDPLGFYSRMPSNEQREVMEKVCVAKSAPPAAHPLTPTHTHTDRAPPYCTHRSSSMAALPC